MANINLPLDDELLDRIDEARGDVPRVRWIRRAIALMLEFGEHGGSEGSSHGS